MSLGTIEQLSIYPLTGARALDQPELEIGYAGPRNDRIYVCYDPDTMARISSKPGQAPALMRIEPGSTGHSFDFYDETGKEVIDSVDLADDYMSQSFSGQIVVNEFGTHTECFDMGDNNAATFSKFLGRSIRLAAKTRSWQSARAGLVMPENRTNAPLHIVSRQTLNYIASLAGISNDEVAARMRANIVVDVPDIEPNGEQDWEVVFVRTAVYEPTILRLTRPTMRCPVPGLDPKTGRNLKDVPKTYSNLPKHPNSEGVDKPVIGAYGMLESSITGFETVSLGDTVRVIKRG